MSQVPSSLPYTDTKPHGHADFYFAINATFRFILRRFGYDKLRQYWSELGARYYQPVSANWQSGGMAAVGTYWREFFAAEPGGSVEVTTLADEVRLDVRTCPMIRHLRDHGREIVPCFCQHCYFVSEAMAAPAGMTVRIKGGNGACTQRFLPQASDGGAQKLEDIKEAS